MLVIEQKLLILRKNLVGCDTIISRKQLCAKIDGIEWNNTNFRRGGIPPFSFLGEHYKRAKINNKKEKYLDNQWKILLQ